MKPIILTLALSVFISSYAQISTVNGKIINQNSINDTAFKLVFIKENLRLDSILTKSAGFYSTQINNGFYDIEFTKKNHTPIKLSQVFISKGDNPINFSLRFTVLPIQNKPISKIGTKSKDSIGWTVKDESMLKESVTKTGIRELSGYTFMSAGVSSRGSVSDSYSHITPKAVEGRPYEASGKRKKTVAKEMTKPSSSVNNFASIKAGQITAGHWRDIDHWSAWLKTNEELEIKSAQLKWKMPLQNIRKIRFADVENNALSFTKVILLNEIGDTAWETYTDQNGEAYFWPELNEYKVSLKYNMLVNDKIYQDANQFFNSKTPLKIYDKVSNDALLEIGFVVDATGSMGDEIKYLQVELMDVINRIQKNNSCLKIKTAAVFYRDKGDEYVTRVSPMSLNPANTLNFIGDQSAGGGGDFPEAVDLGLQDAINRLEWTEGKHPKILFLLLDAPPHATEECINRIKLITYLAAAKGIRIVPITASGINKETEFLMKNMAIVSNGEYLYITDDSKIGNAHIKPSGGESKVTYLNDLMVSVINNYSKGEWCKKKYPVETVIDTAVQIDQDSNLFNNQEIVAGNDWFMRFYPNPASQILNIKFTAHVESIKITDINGKVMKENLFHGEEGLTLDISDWNTGIYLVYAVYKNETIAGKLLIMH